MGQRSSKLTCDLTQTSNDIQGDDCIVKVSEEEDYEIPHGESNLMCLECYDYENLRKFPCSHISCSSCIGNYIPHRAHIIYSAVNLQKI